jgi:hypothetical protein
MNADMAKFDSEQSFWLKDWEKQAIIGFHLKNPLEGYRRSIIGVGDVPDSFKWVARMAEIITTVRRNRS